MDQVDAPPHYPVAIIGGGACGICVGAQLTRQLGWDYILLEKSAAVGGTWYGKPSRPFYSDSRAPMR